MTTTTATKPLTTATERPDLEIALDVQHAIDLDRAIPGGVRATVAHGEVTLTGLVHWTFQKLEAAQAARTVRGVRQVRNLIEVKPGGIEPADEVC